MHLLSRIKGLILTPQAEWAKISEEDTSTLDLYRGYIAILALLPPFATFFGSWLFGFSYGSEGVMHPTFSGGLYRAFVQYLLSLPAFFIVAFVISAIAPHFDGKTDDRRALMLTAYSFTPVWLASLFGLIPGLRWLDIGAQHHQRGDLRCCQSLGGIGAVAHHGAREDARADIVRKGVGGERADRNEQPVDMPDA